MSKTALSDTERRRALHAYIAGLEALDWANQGDADAVERAIVSLQVCLELVTPATWPTLWIEAEIAKAGAYMLRRSGDPLDNARVALSAYQAALCEILNDWAHWGNAPDQ